MTTKTAAKSTAASKPAAVRRPRTARSKTVPGYPNLPGYLATLVTDPAKLEALRANPLREMAFADLNSKEKNVLLRGDKDEIARVLAEHDPILAQGAIVITLL